ncbi:MAG: DoxX family membrane protein [Bacteroidetes bacterium]|nr:DoxX family membrane protein [Bacteroidota bacterium]
MRILRITSRILLGIVFVFSGFVKVVDPLGSAYKFIDYFVAFRLEFLEPVAFPLAVFLIAAEFIIGISLLTGFKIEMGTWGVMIFMSVFTPLTLVLAIFNPVEDCGCFGDAIVLTNWQTFYKNLVLMVFVVFAFISRKKYQIVYPANVEMTILSVILLVFVAFSIYSYYHLPLIDFRPYNVGTYIPEKMEIPEGAPQDEYKTILIYEKDGIKKEFTIEDYPWQDTTWKFVDQKSYLIKEGYLPAIHDFDIIDSEGYEITDLVLSDENYSFLMVSYNLSDANQKGLKAANEIALYCNQYGYNFYCLTASSSPEIEVLSNTMSLNFDFFFTDETTLKTIIRSNPGLVLLKDGIIVGKWHYNDFTETEEMKGNYLSGLLTNYRKRYEFSKSLNLFLILFLALSLFNITRKRFFNRHKSD